jgi:hypothetical protein
MTVTLGALRPAFPASDDRPDVTDLGSDLMRLLEPVSAHASIDPDGFCDRHPVGSLDDLYGLDSVARSGEPRLWRVSGTTAVRVFLFHRGTFRVRHDVDYSVLPGTLLRLDSVRVSWYCDGDIHTMTDRRFCALGGPLAGHCFNGSDVLLDDHESHRADSVEPLPVN